ncbi:MAG: CoA transferase, partial [Chloroflexi bacterium]|nr:CoA transferase [Chloroflexota bacterium]
MSAPRPLEGIRVLDLCVVWAGTYATCILADLGAEVIKLENVHVFPPMTRGGRARPPKEMMTGHLSWGTGYPNNEPGPRPWNYCPTFVQLYRNKKSVTIDLTSARGKELLRPLIEGADVFVENNAVGTAEKLGLDYESLRAIRPDIIMLRAPGYGLTGPYREARTLGAHLESVTGHTLLRRYPDRDPSDTSAIFAGDHMAGSQGAFAIMAALRHRRRTGEGQLIELAQAEAAAPMVAQAYMHQAFHGSPPEPVGNRSIYGFAPHNVYPCRSPGDAADGGDRWIAITVTSDAEWRALRAEMDSPPWADASLDENAARLARQDEIDAEIAAWTRDQDDYDLFHRLQAVGVPAAP